MPHFVVLYGPAVSGKGFITDAVKRRLEKMHPEMDPFTDENTYALGIDELVDMNTDYKEKSKELIDQFAAKFDATEEDLRDALLKYVFGKTPKRGRESDEEGRSKKLKTMGQVAEGAIKELLDNLRDLYMSRRGRELGRSDNDRYEALSQGKNVIFETTGWNSSDPVFNYYDTIKYYNRKHEDNPYIISVVYPFVKPDVIIKRVIDRFIESYRAGEGGRIPDPKFVQGYIQTSHRGFLRYIHKPSVSHVLIFDNNDVTIDPDDLVLKFQDIHDQKMIKDGHVETLLDKYPEHFDGVFRQKILESKAQFHFGTVEPTVDYLLDYLDLA